MQYISQVKNVTVVGAGVMGHSLAQVFAQKGYNVRLCDLKEDVLERAMGLIKSTLESLVELGHLPQKEIPAITGRIHPTKDLTEALDRTDFVIEAVSEVPEIKRALFSKLNELCSKDTILASNTSGLDIFKIADIDNPQRLIITHWFSPPHIIPLVEIVPGETTSDEVIALTKKIMESLGKKPIILNKFVPAFIVNRIQNAINRAVFELIENEWATPENIDLAIKTTLGIRMPIVGVAQSLDFAGLDLINKINQGVGTKSTFVEGRVKEGHLGAKTSKGIYDYQGRGEAEILKKRDRLYLEMLKHLERINAFDPV